MKVTTITTNTVAANVKAVVGCRRMDLRGRLVVRRISKIGCASFFGAGGVCCVSVGTSEAVGGGATADAVSLAVTCGGGAVFVRACLWYASFKLAFSRRSFSISRCVSTS